MGKEIFKIAVTDYCNMDCIYCKDHKAIPKDKEMENLFSEREILTFIRMAVKSGATTIHITGGEATVRPNFERLLEAIHFFSLVDKIVLSTNASLMTVEKLQNILKYIDEIHVSYDANQAFDFKKITGLDKCMNEILNTAWTACSLGKKTRITSMMIDKMLPYLPAIADFGKYRDFDLCFKELRTGEYGEEVVPVSEKEILNLLYKRFPDLRQVESEDETIDFYKTEDLKGRLGIVHTNKERNDMIFLDGTGTLHCGKNMRHRVNLVQKLENGANYEDFTSYFQE